MTRWTRRQVAWTRPLAWIPLPLLLFLGAGCDGVRTIEPIGLEPVKLVPAEWEGRWTEDPTECAAAPDGEDEDRVVVIDAASGTLQSRESGGDVYTYLLRTSPAPGLLFVTLREDEADEMVLGAVVRQAGHGVLLVWLAGPGAVNREVTDGRMAGGPGSSPLLLPQPEEVLRRMVTPDDTGLFEWQKPGVPLRCPEK